MLDVRGTPLRRASPGMGVTLCLSPPVTMYDLHTVVGLISEILRCVSRICAASLHVLSCRDERCCKGPVAWGVLYTGRRRERWTARAHYLLQRREGCRTIRASPLASDGCIQPPSYPPPAETPPRSRIGDHVSFRLSHLPRADKQSCMRSVHAQVLL